MQYMITIKNLELFFVTQCYKSDVNGGVGDNGPKPLSNLIVHQNYVVRVFIFKNRSCPVLRS